MKEQTENHIALTSEVLDIPAEFSFPYAPENFTQEERETLLRFFTNIDKPVYAIHNLPQDVVGALFSRYSRTSKSARRVFLDEFWGVPELGIQQTSEFIAEEYKGVGIEVAREHAEEFFKRVFAEYGDDSVIQMGSTHIAFEFVSQIAAKAIEDQRIGAAYIEKSTRYVDFGKKVSGHFLFIEEPSIMNSEFADEFIAWNQAIFETYNSHLPLVINYLRAKYSIENQVFEHPKSHEMFAFADIGDEGERRKALVAYERALKAKAFDTLRVILPATTVTNLGAHLSGQAAENMLNKMLASPYPEIRRLGAMAYQELKKVAPSFLENVDNRYGAITRQYLRDIRDTQAKVADVWTLGITEGRQRNRVRLVDWDEDSDVRIAAQLAYKEHFDRASNRTIFEWAKKIKEEDLRQNPGIWWSQRLAEMIVSSVPDRSIPVLNRRHKLPRAFEHAYAEVEFNVDFGIFRDLQRNRMSTTERQRLSAEEVYIPDEFNDPELIQVRRDYERIADWTRELHRKLVASGDETLVRAAEYVTILGNKLRFNIRTNIRQWAFFAELRTIEGGHLTYRQSMQRAVRQILHVMPFLKPVFAHVNWKKDYGLGRLKAEVKTQEKLSELG